MNYDINSAWADYCSCSHHHLAQLSYVSVEWTVQARVGGGCGGRGLALEQNSPDSPTASTQPAVEW